MKNIEKYPNTADAVKAWGEYHANCNSNIDLKTWLGLDYFGPSSLLEAAKSASGWMKQNRGDVGTVAQAAGDIILYRLNAAIAAEEARPKCGYDKSGTHGECAGGTKPKYNLYRFGDNLVEALHAWASEDQNCDLKHEMEQNGDDPNSLAAILDYWAYDQLVEFIEWLFKRVEEAE